MTYEIICSKCGHTIYAGPDVKSPRAVLAINEGTTVCRKCGVKLSLTNFKIDVKAVPVAFV